MYSDALNTLVGEATCKYSLIQWIIFTLSIFETVNRFGLTFPSLRIIGLLFKNTYIPKPLLKILIQEINIRNHESVLFCFCLAVLLVGS